MGLSGHLREAKQPRGRHVPSQSAQAREKVTKYLCKIGDAGIDLNAVPMNKRYLHPSCVGLPVSTPALSLVSVGTLTLWRNHEAAKHPAVARKYRYISEKNHETHSTAREVVWVFVR